MNGGRAESSDLDLWLCSNDMKGMMERLFDSGREINQSMICLLLCLQWYDAARLYASTADRTLQIIAQ